MVAGPSFCTIVRHSKCGPNYSRRPPNTVLLEIYLHIMRSKYPERRSQESGGSAIDSRYYSFPKVLRLCLDRETLRDHESDKLLLNTIWGTRMKKDLSAVDGTILTIFFFNRSLFFKFTLSLNHTHFCYFIFFFKHFLFLSLPSIVCKLLITFSMCWHFILFLDW